MLNRIIKRDDLFTIARGKILKKSIILIGILIFLKGCSYLPPSSERFNETMSRDIGKTIDQIKIYFTPGYTHYKLEKKGNSLQYYYKSYNYSTQKECRYMYITNLNNVIIDYKILTPNTCKMGYSASW